MPNLELKARLDNLLSTAQAETSHIDLLSPIIVADREECPLCMIPISIKTKETIFKHCCGKLMCKGCSVAQSMNDLKNRVPDHKKKCAFCRQPPPKNEIKALKKLMKKNNSNAFMTMAERYRTGDGMIQSDTKMLEMHIRAAELGDTKAFAAIGLHYLEGSGVEQDRSEELSFYEVAAKKGSVYAHMCLAEFYNRSAELGNAQMHTLIREYYSESLTLECDRSNAFVEINEIVENMGSEKAPQHLVAALQETNETFQKSIKHLKVAANAGYQQAMDSLMELYKTKAVPKEDLTQTLRAFQASTAEMKSKDRDDVRAMGW